MGSPYLIAAAILAAVGVIFLVRKTIQAIEGDPMLWEGEIRRFERKDRRESPLQGAILFTGSSSIRFWKTLSEDMAPLPVLNRGFGGAQIHQVTFYADRIILPYTPKGIVFYAGENDLAGIKFAKKKTPDDVVEAFNWFCENIRVDLPDTPIFFISVKPPKLRRAHWPQMQAANQRVKEYCDGDDLLSYIDIVPGMLDSVGSAREDLFKWDGIHMNEKGYAIWTEVVKPVLLEVFGD